MSVEKTEHRTVWTKIPGIFLVALREILSKLTFFKRSKVIVEIGDALQVKQFDKDNQD